MGCNLVSAYQANKRLSRDLAANGPGWCFSRFGQSENELRDGRIVPIAGAVEENEYGTHRIRIDGTLVRYVQESDCIQLIVEGELPPSTLEVLANDLQEKLSRMENVPCTLDPIIKTPLEQ